MGLSLRRHRLGLAVADHSPLVNFDGETGGLELHFRHSLGLVTYRVGIFELSHEDYIWSVLGRRWASQYPGFAKEPLDGFRHLFADLQQNGSDFLVGSDEDFTKHIRRVRELTASSPRLPA
jgi:hypothetical protein